MRALAGGHVCRMASAAEKIQQVNTYLLRKAQASEACQRLREIRRHRRADWQRPWWRRSATSEAFEKGRERRCLVAVWCRESTPAEATCSALGGIRSKRGNAATYRTLLVHCARSSLATCSRSAQRPTEVSGCGGCILEQSPRRVSDRGAGWSRLAQHRMGLYLSMRPALLLNSANQYPERVNRPAVTPHSLDTWSSQFVCITHRLMDKTKWVTGVYRHACLRVAMAQVTGRRTYCRSGPVLADRGKWPVEGSGGST